MYAIIPKRSTALRTALVLVGALTAAACADEPAAPRPDEALAPELATAAQQGAGVVPNQYVVLFKSDVTDAPARAAALTKAHGGKLRHTYTAALKGFAAGLSAAAAEAISRDPRVAVVEADRVMRAYGTQTMDAAGQPWGLDRIDQKALPLSGTYTYKGDGGGVKVYIIDTGLQANHSQFKVIIPSLSGGTLTVSRAKNVYDAYGSTGADCNGHGTHVAGIVGGKTYGVAKMVSLRGVRVLGGDCGNSGWMSDVLAGVNWVTANHSKPAIANMSLGGSKSAILDSAVLNLVKAGVFVSLAAGNEGQDACNSSPARVGKNIGVFTAAASNKKDERAVLANWSSNYGKCVDGYAPGVAIKSAWINDGTNTIGGTSMAAPHVAGVAAILKQANTTWSPNAIEIFLKWAATPNVITGNPADTPNRLLHKAPGV